MGQKMFEGIGALVLGVMLAATGRAEDSNPFNGENPPTPGAEKRTERFDSEAAARRIEQVLQSPLQAPLEFIETPLNQIVEVIADEYEIPIQFDIAALDAVAASPEVEVTINVGNVSLRSALDLMLRNAGEELAYVIDDEVLLITTQQEAELRFEVRVYRVDDLVTFKSPYSHGEQEFNFDALIDVIVATIERDSWQENGTGEGEIQPYPAGIIVVSQTRRVHEQIDQLLQRLREVKKSIDEQAAANDEDGAGLPLTRVYALNDDEIAKCEKTREAIRDAIAKSVDWNREVEGVEPDQLFLHVLPRRVLVRHVPAVVEQVGRIVRELAPRPPVSAMIGPTMGGGRGRATNSSGLADPTPGSEDDSQRSPSRRDGGGF